MKRRANNITLSTVCTKNNNNKNNNNNNNNNNGKFIINSGVG